MAEASDAEFEVEVVYALREEQIVATLRVLPGSTVAQAVAQSGISLRCPELAAGVPVVGICGRRVEPSVILREYDRVEIYRPLIADPKQARRVRARLPVKSRR
ncbi:MAG: RnfH family protein [Burkholderiales bacterium]